MHAYMHYITLCYATLCYVTLHYTTLRYITFTLHLHYIYITFTLHYITLHLHYIYIYINLHLHFKYIDINHTIFVQVFFTKRKLAQYPHRSALQAPYFACAEIWWIAMFLAYQRASRPYKRLVVDDFTFVFLHFSSTYILGVGGMRL